MCSPPCIGSEDSLSYETENSNGLKYIIPSCEQDLRLNGIDIKVYFRNFADSTEKGFICRHEVGKILYFQANYLWKNI